MGHNTSTAVLENQCEQLSWDAANRLPSWIKAGDVACMSPTVEDLQASEQARALLVKAEGRVRDETEYNDGVVAYAEGRYADAIAHFQAAMPSVSRVQAACSNPPIAIVHSHCAYAARAPSSFDISLK
jgi:hypothetical protein